MTADTPEPANRLTIFRRLVDFIRRSLSNYSKDSYSIKDYEDLDGPRKEMIRGIFELSDKNARDIMIPRVDMVAVDINIALLPLVKTVYEAGHSRLPVYEDRVDNIVGILYAKDLLKQISDKSKKFQVKKILHAPYFVPETMPLDELLLEFKRRKLHIAIVVDEYGGVGGIITLEDILEEIVGDINDEYDAETLPELEKTGVNTYEVDSRMTLTDFNDQMKLNLPTDDCDTIGGFVFDLFGKIPDQGEEVTHGDMSFMIKDIKGTVINRITITMTGKK